MTKLEKMISYLKSLSNCRILEVSGTPMIDAKKHTLPGDLKEFYELCSGIYLFEDKEYPIYIVSPEELVLANPVIVGDLYEEDISSDWYIICTDGNGEYLTIDLNKKRLGKCYDSFFDRHGLIGETKVIANSFTDLLEKLIENKGEYWYWLRDDFKSLGDAYDDPK